MTVRVRVRVRISLVGFWLIFCSTFFFSLFLSIPYMLPYSVVIVSFFVIHDVHG